MYDDHSYCGDVYPEKGCGKHKADCWCHPLEDQDVDRERICAEDHEGLDESRERRAQDGSP